MIDQLWETNVFTLNLATSANKVLALPGLEDQYNEAIRLLSPVVQQYLLKGFARDDEFILIPPHVAGVVPTFSIVWFLNSTGDMILKDPIASLPSAEQFKPRDWTKTVTPGDVFIFPAYTEYDYATMLHSTIITLDVQVGRWDTRF